MDAPEYDRLIDIAAARLTRGVPPAAMRERVLARVATERRRSWIWTWVPATAFGVLVASAAGAVVLQRAASPEFAVVERAALVDGGALGLVEESGSPGLKTEASGFGTARASGSTSPIDAARGSDGRTALGTGQEAEPAPSAALVAWQARALPPLPAVVGLTVPDIQPEAIGVTQLEVKPLAGVAPDEIAPESGGVR